MEGRRRSAVPTSPVLQAALTSESLGAGRAVGEERGGGVSGGGKEVSSRHISCCAGGPYF